jgi:hypothetical protein
MIASSTISATADLQDEGTITWKGYNQFAASDSIQPSQNVIGEVAGVFDSLNVPS